MNQELPHDPLERIVRGLRDMANEFLRDELDEAADLITAQDAMLRRIKAVIGPCRDIAMEWTIKGRIPECGKFGEIAQDLDALIPDEKPPNTGDKPPAESRSA